MESAAFYPQSTLSQKGEGDGVKIKDMSCTTDTSTSCIQQVLEVVDTTKSACLKDGRNLACVIARLNESTCISQWFDSMLDVLGMKAEGCNRKLFYSIGKESDTIITATFKYNQQR